jgi:glycosyltransferase involved in cell wall biosynthesis
LTDSLTGPAELRVAVDAEPLLGHRTGVGNFCYGLLSGLTDLPGDERAGLDLSAFAVTWRMRDALGPRLPRAVPLRGRPMPARPLRTAWEKGLDLPLELFLGPVDVVHGSNFVVPPTWRAARVVTVHDLVTLHYPEMCHPATLIFPDLIRRAIRQGAWVHTPSQFVADEVLSAFGADPSRVRAVASGIPPLDRGLDDSDRSPDNRPTPFARYILAVGTIEPRKDYPTLIRAFETVAGAVPDVGLVIAGAEGWGARAVYAQVAAARAADRIVRLGYVSDRQLGRLLRGSSVLAYPSRYEGFGFPPLQAMKAGIPVVATAVGSIPEVLGDGALLVPPRDADVLAGALVEVLSDEQRWSALAAAGRRRARDFTWAQCARGLLGVYREAASGRG